jgi:hypothetical protein
MAIVRVLQKRREGRDRGRTERAIPREATDQRSDLAHRAAIRMNPGDVRKQTGRSEPPLGAEQARQRALRHRRRPPDHKSARREARQVSEETAERGSWKLEGFLFRTGKYVQIIVDKWFRDLAQLEEDMDQSPRPYLDLSQKVCWQHFLKVVPSRAGDGGDGEPTGQGLLLITGITFRRTPCPLSSQKCAPSRGNGSPQGAI